MAKTDREIENELVAMYRARAKRAGTRFDEKAVRQIVRKGLKWNAGVLD